MELVCIAKQVTQRANSDLNRPLKDVVVNLFLSIKKDLFPNRRVVSYSDKGGDGHEP